MSDGAQEHDSIKTSGADLRTRSRDRNGQPDCFVFRDSFEINDVQRLGNARCAGFRARRSNFSLTGRVAPFEFG